MNHANIIGYVAALLGFITFWMKTMVPLRTLGIASNPCFIGYGYLASAYSPLVLHLLLLPLNLMRLREMLQLTRQVRRAADGNLSMDWLKPFTSSRRISAGDVLFHKGSASLRFSRPTRRARRRCNALKPANSWRSPTARSDNSIIKTRRSDFISSN